MGVRLGRVLDKIIAAITLLPALGITFALGGGLVELASRFQVLPESAVSGYGWILGVSGFLAFVAGILIAKFDVFSKLWLQYRRLVAETCFRGLHGVYKSIRFAPTVLGPVWSIAGVFVVWVTVSTLQVRENVPIADELMARTSSLLNRSSLSLADEGEVRALLRAVEKAGVGRTYASTALFFEYLRALYPSEREVYREVRAVSLHDERVSSVLGSIQSANRGGDALGRLARCLCVKLDIRRFKQTENVDYLCDAHMLLTQSARDQARTDGMMDEFETNALAGIRAYFYRFYRKYCECAARRQHEPWARDELAKAARKGYLQTRHSEGASTFGRARAANNLADLTLSTVREQLSPSHGSDPSRVRGSDSWRMASELLVERRKGILELIDSSQRPEFMMTVSQLSALLAHGHAHVVEADFQSRMSAVPKTREAQASDAAATSAAEDRDLDRIRQYLVDATQFCAFAFAIGYRKDRFDIEPAKRELRRVLEYSGRVDAFRFQYPALHKAFNDASGRLARTLRNLSNGK